MGYSWYWLVWIPVLLMFSMPAILLIVDVVRGITLPRGLRRGRAIVCGRCSHEIAEITEASPLPIRCPECGTRYAQAGLLSLALAKRTRPGMASVIISWTVLSIGIAGFAASMIQSFSAIGTSYPNRQLFSHTIASVRTDGTASTGVDGYEIRFDGDLEFLWGSPVSGGTLSVTIRSDNGPAATIEIDPATGSWEIPAISQSGGAFDAAAAIASLQAAGIDTTPAYVGFEANRLVDAVGFVRSDPDTASYSVLGQPGGTTTPASTPVGVATNWTPSNLTVIDQQGDIASGLRFVFESDIVDSNDTGSSSGRVFDGSLELGFATDATSGTPRLDTIALTLRPPNGWPVSIRYNLDESTGTLTQGANTDTYVPADDSEAVGKLAELGGLTDDAGSMDAGLYDVLSLIQSARQDPTVGNHLLAGGSHIHTHGHTHNQPISNPVANAAGDGEPDGGFVEVRPATQNWMPPPGGYANSFPIAFLITLGVCFLLYAGGVVFVVLRRYKIYPAHLVGPEGPPNPSTVGPRLPGGPT